MYSVDWTRQALAELTDEHAQADSPTQKLIEAAVKRFNASAGADPFALGESRAGTRRIALDAPCGFSFTVDRARGAVRVNHFWTY